MSIDHSFPKPKQASTDKSELVGGELDPPPTTSGGTTETNRKGLPWVYELNKQGLIKQLHDRNSKTTGNVATLRKRLVKIMKRGQPSNVDTSKINTTISTREINTTESESSELDTSSAESTSEGSESEDEDKGEENVNPREHRGKKKKSSDGEIIDRVRKWSIRYDGGKDIVEFLERVEELSDTYQIPRDGLMQALLELLKGKALVVEK